MSKGWTAGSSLSSARRGLLRVLHGMEWAVLFAEASDGLEPSIPPHHALRKTTGPRRPGPGRSRRRTRRYGVSLPVIASTKCSPALRGDRRSPRRALQSPVLVGQRARRIRAARRAPESAEAEPSQPGDSSKRTDRGRVATRQSRSDRAARGVARPKLVRTRDEDRPVRLVGRATARPTFDGRNHVSPILAFTLRGRWSECVRGRLPLPQALRD